MIRGVLSNIFDKGAITIIQLLMIPVLTSAWGAEGYGIWLMLMTVPTFILLSDFGFGIAAGAAMTQAVALRDFARARNILHSAFLFTSIMLTIAGSLGVAFAAYVYLHTDPGGVFSAPQIAGAVAVVVAYSAINALMLIITMAYRATHAFAFAMSYSAIVILIEGFTTLLLVHFGAHILQVTLTTFCLRLVSFPIFLNLLRRRQPWVSFGFSAATKDTFRALLKPSLAALGLTFAAALLLQGVLSGLGATAGAAVVAIFGPSRTLSRIPLQFAGLVLRPSLPELTHALSTGNKALARRLDRLNLGIAAAVTMPFAIGLTLWGPQLLDFISAGNLGGSHVLFFWLSLAAVFNALWNALAAGLIAMNRQVSFAPMALASAIAAILVTLVTADATIAAMAMAFAECAVLIRVFWIRRKDGG
ncbi:hypothetical protein CKO11_11200 [Rhodobacter sp. TJ_12]|uniref:lipopolysaccharide biosynthesis protein n=1 Tax=Rhodobacter sp. TJ_12 TaxID=2029399 RepID=UPI001CC0B8FB|nr:hypothetical protein [Rhodobacter sp. TJ_12]MBZ4023026.1 hypothetical protein [Rhodobacter sp. TJ_12]